jgi:hypothetical protein
MDLISSGPACPATDAEKLTDVIVSQISGYQEADDGRAESTTVLVEEGYATPTQPFFHSGGLNSVSSGSLCPPDFGNSPVIPD